MMLRSGAAGAWAGVLIVMVVIGCVNSPPIVPPGNGDNANDNTAANDNGGADADDNTDDTDADNDNASNNDIDADDNQSDDNDGPADDVDDDMPPVAIIDSDGDGFSDEEEAGAIPGSDPFNPNDTPDNPIDSDGDGCSNFDETNFAGFCDGDPFTTDDPIDVDNPDASFTFSMTVARHMSVTFTDPQVDAVLAEAGDILKQDDTECPDIATNTTFSRSGVTTTFSIGSSVLTTESQLDNVFDVPQDIKIVDMMVGVCGVPANDDFSVVLGCAFTGGSLVIVKTAAADVWAHEWGHVQGLGHRDGCARNLMHSFEVETNAVNAEEREAFLTPTPNPRRAKIAMPAVDPTAAMHLARSADEPLADWLQRVADGTYVAGVPSGALRELDSNATTHLSAMLDDPQWADRRSNIVRMMGFTKDHAAVSRLVSYIEQAAGELDADAFASLAESFLAIGRLAKHDPSGAAVEWLIDGADPAPWKARGVTWTYRSYAGNGAAELLARLSILALSISELPAAKIELESLRSPSARNAMYQQHASLIDDAIVRLKGNPRQSRVADYAMRQR